jgi:multicomponent Na+:H+ antiporter subunit E
MMGAAGAEHRGGTAQHGKRRAAGRGATAAGRTRGPGGHDGTIRWLFRTVPYLAAFWLLLSAHVEALFLTLGVLSLALVCWLSWRAGLTRRTGVPVRLMVRLPWYALWLATEVLVSSVAVSRRVWSPRPALSPVVADTSSAGLSELSQVIYANSITLTPGTLSLDLDEDQIEVHSLDPVGVKDLHAGAMLRRVRRLEAQR